MKNFLLLRAKSCTMKGSTHSSERHEGYAQTNPIPLFPLRSDMSLPDHLHRNGNGFPRTFSGISGRKWFPAWFKPAGRNGCGSLVTGDFFYPNPCPSPNTNRNAFSAHPTDCHSHSSISYPNCHSHRTTPASATRRAFHPQNFRTSSIFFIKL